MIMFAICAHTTKQSQKSMFIKAIHLILLFMFVSFLNRQNDTSWKPDVVFGLMIITYIHSATQRYNLHIIIHKNLLALQPLSHSCVADSTQQIIFYLVFYDTELSRITRNDYNYYVCVCPHWKLIHRVFKKHQTSPPLSQNVASREEHDLYNSCTIFKGD